MAKVKVGVIGMGRFGELHAATYKKIDTVELTSISSRKPEHVNEMAQKYDAKPYTDYRELLKDPNVDAVSISVPPGVQREIAVRAMQAGKHVLMEKPIAITLEDADAIAKSARETGVVAMVGYVERFNPSLRRTKALIQNGKIGDVYKVSSRRASRFGVKPDWVFSQVGMMIHNVGHDLDILRWMMDDDISTVYAMGGSYMRRVPGQPDNLTLLLRFKKGGMGLIENSWTLPSKYSMEENDLYLDIMGTEGVLKVDNFDQMISMCNESTGFYHPGILRWPGDIQEDAGLEHYALKDELEHFIKAVKGEAEALLKPAEAAYILRILIAANESERTGKPVEIRQKEEMW